jgi:hypothetical protein
MTAITGTLKLLPPQARQEVADFVDYRNLVVDIYKRRDRTFLRRPGI